MLNSVLRSAEVTKAYNIRGSTLKIKINKIGLVMWHPSEEGRACVDAGGLRRERDGCEGFGVRGMLPLPTDSATDYVPMDPLGNWRYSSTG